MNTSWNYKSLLWCCLFFFTVACSSTKYTVYDRGMNKTKIDLSQSNQAVIMINNSYCSPCLPMLKDSLSNANKNCILVCLVEKSKSAILFKAKELNNSNLLFENVYFQFYKKNDPYSPRRTNKLYRKYDSVKAPYALIRVNDSIVKIY